ncbi:MAG: glycosyltransferase family 39 protein [Anaerolineae bacterium]|nr:glycosyltransferase family 39 protein [Anaerolineae bacterium]
MPIELFYLLLLLVLLVAVLWWQVRRLTNRGPIYHTAESTMFWAKAMNWLLTPVGSRSLTPSRRRPTRPWPPAPTELSPGAMRPTVTVLLIGGLLLAVLAQMSYRSVFRVWQPWLTGLTVLGGLFFVLGGIWTLRPRPPRFLIKLTWWLTHFFHLAGWQLTLLTLAPLFAWLARLAAGNSLQALNPGVAILAWFLAVTCLVLGSYRWWQEATFSLTRREGVGLLLLFLLALGLRGTLLSQYPSTLSGDEGSAGLMAAGFRNGNFNNIFTVGWFSFPTFYYWVQGWGVLLLGQTIEGLRISSAVAGALTVVAVYGLGRVMFNRLLGFVAAALLLACHHHIQFSRIGLNNIWDGLFLTIALAALWHGWQSGRRGAFLLCGLAVGLGQYFYVSLRVLPLLLLLWVGCAFLFQRDRFRQRWPDLLLTGYIALVVYLPMLLYFSTHLQEFNAPMQRVTIFEWWLEAEQLKTGQSAAAIVLEQMSLTARGFTHIPLRHWYDPGVPLLLAGPAALFLLGLVWSLLRFDLRYLLLWLPLLAHIVLGGISQDAPASQRYAWIVPITLVIAAIPLTRTIGWLHRAWPRREKWVIGFAAAFLLWLMGTDLHYYFFRAYQSGYILGGINTEAATEIAHYLRNHPEQGQLVYFFGFPRMGYTSHSTIPYLAPQMHGVDILDPLTAPLELPSQENLIFIFLPERLNEYPFVRATFPKGTDLSFFRANGDLLFTVYDVP